MASIAEEIRVSLYIEKMKIMEQKSSIRNNHAGEVGTPAMKYHAVNQRFSTRVPQVYFQIRVSILLLYAYCLNK